MFINTIFTLWLYPVDQLINGSGFWRPRSDGARRQVDRT